MKTWAVVLASLIAMRVVAEPIKSADGRVIEATVTAITETGITIDRDGAKFDLAWDKLDKEQADDLQRTLYIKTSYDRFKNQTTVGTKKVKTTVTRGSGEVEVHVYDVLTGHVVRSNSRRVLFSISRQGSGWSWLNLSDTTMLLDGVKVPITAKLGLTDVMDSGGVIEFVDSVVPDELFLRMVAAKKIEFQVGTDEFALTDETVAGFAWLADMLHMKDSKPLAESLPK